MFLDSLTIYSNILKNNIICSKSDLLKNKPNCSDFQSANYKFVTSVYIYKTTFTGNKL